jgi:hypothetical protein
VHAVSKNAPRKKKKKCENVVSSLGASWCRRCHVPYSTSTCVYIRPPTLHIEIHLLQVCNIKMSFVTIRTTNESGVVQEEHCHANEKRKNRRKVQYADFTDEGAIARQRDTNSTVDSLDFGSRRLVRIDGLERATKVKKLLLCNNSFVAMPASIFALTQLDTLGVRSLLCVCVSSLSLC